MNIDKDIFLRAAEIIRDNFTTSTYGYRHGKTYKVCMEGALRLASTMEATGVTSAADAIDTLEGPNCKAHIATIRLAQIIPACDGSCANRLERIHAGQGTVAAQGGFTYHKGSPYRVYHYNDWHCDGGLEAAKWLEKAADELGE